MDESWENLSFLTAEVSSHFWLAYRYKVFSKNKFVTQARKP